jgi:hypothetical protein
MRVPVYEVIINKEKDKIISSCCAYEEWPHEAEAQLEEKRNTKLGHVVYLIVRSTISADHALLVANVTAKLLGDYYQREALGILL